MSTAGADRRSGTRAAGVVDEVEAVGPAREPGRLGERSGAARDRPSIGATSVGTAADQLRVGRRERRQHEQPQVEVAVGRGRASPRTVATVDCSLPPTSPGTSQSRLIPTVRHAHPAASR